MLAEGEWLGVGGFYTHTTSGLQHAEGQGLARGELHFSYDALMRRHEHVRMSFVFPRTSSGVRMCVGVFE